MASDLIQAALLYRSGPERSFPVPEREEVRLGFEGTNDISLPFEGVSRRHARISYDGKSFWIEDTQSANGTFLNARPVTKKERLQHLDVITLGRSTDLIFMRKTMELPRVVKRGIRAAWLETVDGLEVGTRQEIFRGNMTIGRSRSNNVVADSQLVSKMHVRLDRTGPELLLVDLQSANGTFVNGERIESRILKDGDEINLGGSRTFLVRIEEGDIQTSAVAPLASVSARSVIQPLPADWRTRIEWTPEEQAARQGIGKKAFSRGGITTPRSAVPPEKAEPAAPKEPASPPPPKAAAAAAAREPAPGIAAAQPGVSATKAPTPPAQPPPAAVPVVGAPSPARPVTPPAAPPPAPARAESPSALEATRPMTRGAPPRRLVLEGKGQTFDLPAGASEVGRLPGMAVCLKGQQISRHHATIRVTEGGATIEDPGSSNGTFVNGEKVRSPRALSDGDELRFGDLPFHVRLSREPGGKSGAQ